MFNIFKYDKHGIWLKNKDAEVVLIERNLLDYAEEFLAMYLTSEGLTKQDAKQIAKTVKEYKGGYIIH